MGRRIATVLAGGLLTGWIGPNPASAALEVVPGYIRRKPATAPIQTHLPSGHDQDNFIPKIFTPQKKLVIMPRRYIPTDEDLAFSPLVLLCQLKQQIRLHMPQAEQKESLRLLSILTILVDEHDQEKEKALAAKEDAERIAETIIQAAHDREADRRLAQEVRVARQKLTQAAGLGKKSGRKRKDGPRTASGRLSRAKKDGPSIEV